MDDLTEVKTDVKWIKSEMTEMKRWMENRDDQSNQKYAPKYVEKIVWFITLGAMGWTLNQLLSLIPTVHALIQ